MSSSHSTVLQVPMYRMMRAYSYELRAAAVAEGKENTSSRILMGEMYNIYYDNRDLRSRVL